LVGAAAALVLFVSLFLPWFSTNDENRNSTVNELRGLINAFEAYEILPWLLIAASAAPFILGWIIVRGHKLSWPRGELTAIVGIVAFVLIVLNGIVLGKPGDAVEVSLAFGYLVALAGAAGIAASGIFRQTENEPKRKPPGEL